MRLRTLPVSVAGVIAGTGCGAYTGHFRPFGALCCLVFAVLAQIASNFGNEYFDYKAGLDRPGREGFRRGVTEGDIAPGAMLAATLITLGLACALGLVMMFWSGLWWLLIPGVLIAIFALAYSAGPYPLSHHGLGDVAVVLFFGVVPVSLTTLMSSGSFGELSITLPTSVAVGLLAANVLIVNNYRDADDDRAVGKHTTVVIFGRRVMQAVYLLDGLVAVLLMWNVWAATMHWGSLLAPVIYLAMHLKIWSALRKRRGSQLNPLLGLTAVVLLIFSVLTTIFLTLAGGI